MPSLQIRDLPRHIFEALSARARRERRSLAQQAVVELERMDRASARRRRLETVGRLRQRLAESPFNDVSRSPVEVIREDRDR